MSSPTQQPRTPSLTLRGPRALPSPPGAVPTLALDRLTINENPRREERGRAVPEEPRTVQVQVHSQPERVTDARTPPPALRSETKPPPPAPSVPAQQWTQPLLDETDLPSPEFLALLDSLFDHLDSIGEDGTEGSGWMEASKYAAFWRSYGGVHAGITVDPEYVRRMWELACVPYRIGYDRDRNPIPRMARDEFQLFFAWQLRTSPAPTVAVLNKTMRVFNLSRPDHVRFEKIPEHCVPPSQQQPDEADEALPALPVPEKDKRPGSAAPSPVSSDYPQSVQSATGPGQTQVSYSNFGPGKPLPSVSSDPYSVPGAPVPNVSTYPSPPNTATSNTQNPYAPSPGPSESSSYGFGLPMQQPGAPQQFGPGGPPNPGLPYNRSVSDSYAPYAQPSGPQTPALQQYQPPNPYGQPRLPTQNQPTSASQTPKKFNLWGSARVKKVWDAAVQPGRNAQVAPYAYDPNAGNGGYAPMSSMRPGHGPNPPPAPYQGPGSYGQPGQTPSPTGQLSAQPTGYYSGRPEIMESGPPPNTSPPPLALSQGQTPSLQISSDPAGYRISPGQLERLAATAGNMHVPSIGQGYPSTLANQPLPESAQTSSRTATSSRYYNHPPSNPSHRPSPDQYSSQDLRPSASYRSQDPSSLSGGWNSGLPQPPTQLVQPLSASNVAKLGPPAQTAQMPSAAAHRAVESGWTPQPYLTNQDQMFAGAQGPGQQGYTAEQFVRQQQGYPGVSQGPGSNPNNPDSFVSTAYSSQSPPPSGTSLYGAYPGYQPGMQSPPTMVLQPGSLPSTPTYSGSPQGHTQPPPDGAHHDRPNFLGMLKTTTNVLNAVAGLERSVARVENGIAGDIRGGENVGQSVNYR